MLIYILNDPLELTHIVALDVSNEELKLLKQYHSRCVFHVCQEKKKCFFKLERQVGIRKLKKPMPYPGRRRNPCMVLHCNVFPFTFLSFTMLHTQEWIK